MKKPWSLPVYTVIVACTGGVAWAADTSKAPALPALGANGGVRGQMSSPADIAYGDNGESVAVKSGYRGNALLAVDSRYAEKRSQSSLDPSGYEGFWETKMNSDVGRDLLEVEAEMALSSFDPDTSTDFGDGKSRLLRLGASGSWKGVGYGVRYLSVGKDFDPFKLPGQANKRKVLSDREGNEAWVKRQFGKIGVKSFVKSFHDNVERDPKRARFTEQTVGGKLDYTLLAWPYVGYSVTYATGGKTSSDEPARQRSYNGAMESVMNSLDFSGQTWSGSLGAERLKSGDFSGPVTTVTYYLSGSYYPAEGFSITPDLMLTDEEYTGLGARTASRAASLSLAYRPARTNVGVSVYGYYATDENKSWGIDTNNHYFEGRLDWPSKPNSNRWSLSVAHEAYTDQIYAGASDYDVTLWLKFRSSFAAWLPGQRQRSVLGSDLRWPDFGMPANWE